MKNKTLLLVALLAVIVTPAFAQEGPPIEPPYEDRVTDGEGWTPLSHIQKDPLIKLSWDEYELDDDKDQLAGYRVHFSKESGGGDDGIYEHIINVGMGIRFLDEDPRPGREGDPPFMSFRPIDPLELPGWGTWYCVVTCYNIWGLESDYSNEISTTRVRPKPPGGLTTVRVTVEASADLTEWEPIASVERELTHSEFFRMKIETE